MKTTTNLNSELLREELRQTAVEAFQNSAISAIHLKAALNLSNREDALEPNPMWVGQMSDVEAHINVIKRKIKEASNVVEQPAAETHEKFLFYKNGEPFDVRPILSLLDCAGVEGLISALDTIMFDYVHNRHDDDFSKDVKSNLYMIREVRNAFMRATDQIEMDSWLENRTEAEKEKA